MFIYIFLFAIIFFLRNCKDVRLFYCVLFVLSFVLGFRAFEIGQDTHSYIEYFNDSGSEGYMEPLWNLMIGIVKYCGLSAYSFNFFIALLTLFIYGHIAKIYSIKPFSALFFLFSMGFYLMMFNIMRQMFAVILVMYATTFLFKDYSLQTYSNKTSKKSSKNRLIFVTLVIAATLVHTSSLIALLLLFINKIKISTFQMILLLSVTAVVGLLIPLDLIAMITFQYARDVNDGDSFFRTSLASSCIYLLGTNAIFLIGLYSNKDTEKINSGNYFWIIITFVGLCLFNFFINILIGLRIAYFFTIYETIFFSNIRRNKRIASFLIYLFAFLSFFRFMYGEIKSQGNDGSLLPYRINVELFDIN